MNWRRLLLVDPDAGFRNSLAEQLEGFEVAQAADLPRRPAHGLVLVGAIAPQRVERWAQRHVEVTVVRLERPVRVAELIRQLAGSADRRPVLGPWRLDRWAKRLDGPDGSVRLTEKEAAMLEFLVEADGDAVTREAMLATVWGYAAEAMTHTLETHVYRLRRKLGDGILITDAGGYRLFRGGG